MSGKIQRLPQACARLPAKFWRSLGGVWWTLSFLFGDQVCAESDCCVSLFIDLLMGFFRGAVFHHDGGAWKQPIKQPTEMPTSTMVLMGRFPSLMGRFPTLMGRFSDFVLRGRFTSWKSTGKQPIKKRGIKRFLINDDKCWNLHDGRVGSNRRMRNQADLCV